MNKYFTHGFLLLLGIAIGILGANYLEIHKPVPEEVKVANEISQVVNGVSELVQDSGTKVTITRTVTEGKKETNNSVTSSTGKSDNHFFRLFGPDRGANDAGSGVQPLTTNGTSVGGSRNWGVLERIWSWVVNWIWTISVVSVLFFLALGVMFFIPATSTIAATIFQWIMSVIPVLGTIISSIFSKITLGKHTTASSEIVTGIDEFKDAVADEDFITATDITFTSTDNLTDKATALTVKIRKRVRELLKLACNNSQDKTTREYVSSVQGS
jgi:hypothetical protein